MTSGPLAGLRVLELGAIGPCAHAGMVLGDLGAEVVRVDRPGASSNPEIQQTGSVLRNRRSVALDLKDPGDAEMFLAMAAAAAVVIEGFRPGVVERLGIGPSECLARNAALVYGRITGWGRAGPLADRAGHDLNYLAVSGLLSTLGDADRPPLPPLNLVGDYGGGSMVLVVGVLAAVMEARRSGVGQVVDASMLGGITMLSELIWSLRRADQWSDDRQANLIDGGAPFYATYECADGRFLSVAALETRFYQELVAKLGMLESALPSREDRSNWPMLRALFEDVIRQRSRDEWTRLFDGSDACVAPVLSMSEAARHPQMRAAAAVYETHDGTDAAPAPGFSVSALAEPIQPRPLDADREWVTTNWLYPNVESKKDGA